MKKLNLSYTDGGGKAKWHSLLETVSVLQKLNIELPHDPKIPLVGMSSRNEKCMFFKKKIIQKYS